MSHEEEFRSALELIGEYDFSVPLPVNRLTMFEFTRKEGVKADDTRNQDTTS